MQIIKKNILQPAGTVNVDLQVLKAVNKGHLKIVLTYIIEIMIYLKHNQYLWQTDGLKTYNLLLLFKEMFILKVNITLIHYHLWLN